MSLNKEKQEQLKREIRSRLKTLEYQLNTIRHCPNSAPFTEGVVCGQRVALREMLMILEGEVRFPEDAEERGYVRE